MGAGRFADRDDAKRVANLDQRGIDFVDVDQCFDGRPALVVEDRRRVYGEGRENAIVALRGLVVHVAFTNRSGRVRLISARVADRGERSAYHDVFGRDG